MKKLTSKLGLFALAGAIAFGTASCKKEFVDTRTTETTSTSTNENTNSSWNGNAVYNRTVDYSVVVTAQTAGSFRSPQGVSDATVAVAVGGEVMTATTDANGVAAFSGLTYGIASVSVSAGGHASAHFTADLEDSNDDIDNHTTRTASTIVTLVPTSGLGTATVMGELDYENRVPSSLSSFDNYDESDRFDPITSAQGATMTARVDFDNVDGGNVGGSGGWITHSGLGGITEFYMEGIRASVTDPLTTTVGGSSNSNDDDHTYEFSIPATSYGLEVMLIANPFTAQRITVSADPNNAGDGIETISDYEYTYEANGGAPNNMWSDNAHPGQVFVWDIKYE